MAKKCQFQKSRALDASTPWFRYYVYYLHKARKWTSDWWHMNRYICMIFFSVKTLDDFPPNSTCNQSPCCTFVPWVISWISLAARTDGHSSTSHHQGGKILAPETLVIDQCQMMPHSTFWAIFRDRSHQELSKSWNLRFNGLDHVQVNCD